MLNGHITIKTVNVPGYSKEICEQKGHQFVKHAPNSRFFECVKQ